jgi:phosphate starvation-inducible membrane PsiE
MATLERKPVFSVGHFQTLHVNSMYGKYRRGVAAFMYFYNKLVVLLYLESKYNLTLSFSIYSLQRSVSHTGLVNLTMLLGW